jgi:hypothetical protein
MLLLCSLTSYQPHPKSKKSFPWFLLRFTSSNGLPTAVLQGFSGRAMLGSAQHCRDCSVGFQRNDMPGSGARPTSSAALSFGEHPAELKQWITDLTRRITEQREWIKPWKDVGELYPNSDVRELKERLSTTGLGSARGISMETHVQQRSVHFRPPCQFVPTMSASSYSLASISHS